MRRLIPTVALLLAIKTSAATGKEPTNIRLENIDGRTWLVDSKGKPFFAHGVTHMGVAGRGDDARELGEAFEELGFTAFGYGCPEVLRGNLPYVESRNHLVPMSTYRFGGGNFGYVDIFDPKEQARLEGIVKTMCLANRDNPNLIGYCWTDLGAWPLENSTGKNWVNFIRTLSEDAPGQKVYREFLDGWKGDDEAARDRAFLRRIAREYCRVLGEANRKFDPDHLIFGDRFTLQSAVPEVLEEMLPYIDAVAIQPHYRPGFPKAQFDRIHKLSGGKPILICDFAIRFEEPGKTIRGWKPEANPKDAGERYTEYVKAAFATPYVIGAFWCNPINSKPSFGKTGIKQGLFDGDRLPRPELNRAILELNQFLVDNTPKTATPK